MLTNIFFNNTGARNEQRLIENMLIEQIKIHGVEVNYIPRVADNIDEIYKEDPLQKFEVQFPIEVWVADFTGFRGEGDIFTKFGYELRDQITFIVARRRFEEEVVDVTNLIRPREGDVIYFSVTNDYYEIKFVEHESQFYPLGSLYIYELKCEKYEYSSERFDTGDQDIDRIEDEFSVDTSGFQIVSSSGQPILSSGGDPILSSGFSLDDHDNNQDNQIDQQISDEIKDFSEENPFGES